MKALPPLPDDRAVVLVAMNELGALPDLKTDSLTAAVIGAQAAVGAGQAWLALTQLRHQGFVTSVTPLDPFEPRKYRLTTEGIALIPHLKGTAA